MSAGTAVGRATGLMTVKAGKIEEEVEEAVSAVEVTLVIPADDLLLAIVRESVVAAGIFSASSSALPFRLPSRRLPVHHYRHQRGEKRKEGRGASSDYGWNFP